MRLTKAGIKNKQDWDIKDHLTAGHSPVAPPLILAMTNIGTSAANLESAARALKRIDEPYYAAQVALMVKTLDAIVSALKSKEV